MENQVYERDYSEKRTGNFEELPQTNSLSELQKNVLPVFAAYLRQIPNVIVPEKRQAYGRILKKCDAFAELFHGKIRAMVDYEKWDANIQLTLCFAEFSNVEDFELLKDIAENAYNLCFTVGEDGSSIQMTVSIGYFDDLPMDETVTEETLARLEAAAAEAGITRCRSTGEKSWGLCLSLICRS